MSILEVMQISAGVSPAFVVWVAMELRGLRRDLHKQEERTEELERVVFKKGGRAYA